MAVDRVTEACAHLPLRPGWNCRDCGLPWPCAVKRAALSVEFRHDRTALVVYLAVCLTDAIDDFGRPGREPVGDLFERFLGWARRRHQARV